MKLEIASQIIAGASALAGVALSQAISIALSFLDKRHQKQILLRQKYEQLMFEFQESLTYVSEVQNCRSVSDLQAHPHSPSAGRAVSLCYLYFPDLAPVLKEHQASLISFYGAVVSCFNPNIAATAGAQLHVADKDRNTIKTLNEQKNKTLNALISHASKYTKA